MQEFISTAGDLAGLLALIAGIPGTVLALRQLTAPRDRDRDRPTPPADPDR